jgi:LmbE family N-acetylglucosaminyl deacetylase
VTPPQREQRETQGDGPTPVGLPHVVVVEPHMDDAALSVGGRLLLRRGRARVTILSVVKWSNYTRELMHGGAALDVQAVTELRCAEAARAASALGAAHRAMDELDAPLRFQPAKSWSQGPPTRLLPAFKAWTAFAPSREEIDALAARLREQLAALDPDELWFPLGAGWNVDHGRTRDACLAVLAGLPDGDRPRVLAYEDVPYAHRSEDQVVQIVRAIERTGCAISRVEEDVSAVFAEKLAALAAFKSQHDLAACERDVRAAAQAAGEGRLVEVAWELRAPGERWPRALLSGPATSALLPDRRRLREGLRVRFAPWVAKGGRWTRISVLGLAPFGRFEEAMRLLLRTFPRARLRVLIGAGAAWETASFRDERLELVEVRGGLFGWTLAIARELLRFGTPTLVVARRGWLLSPLLPFRPRVATRFMGDACAALTDLADAPDLPSKDASRGVKSGR